MNVTFHTIGSVATAAALSSTRLAQRSLVRDRLPIIAVGFVLGVLVHGVLDHAPHTYPIPSVLDVIIGLVLFVAAIAITKQEHRLLLSVCFIGAVLPDLIDLGPAILNRHFGWSVPVMKVFPWHWPKYSGSIFDHRWHTTSILSHCVVLGVSFALLILYRCSLFRSQAK